MRTLEIDPFALQDLEWLVEHDRKAALRALKLIREIVRNPFEGSGKPEPLKHQLAGAWSRRITQRDRLVYTVQADKIRVLACREHY